MFFDNWRVQAASIGCLDQFSEEIDTNERLYNTGDTSTKDKIFEYYKKHCEYLDFRRMIRNVDIMLKNRWQEFVSNNSEFNIIDNDVIKFTIINTTSKEQQKSILKEFLSKKSIV